MNPLTFFLVFSSYHLVTALALAQTFAYRVSHLCRVEEHNRIVEIIRMEDSPERLAQILDTWDDFRRYHCGFYFISDVIEYNRPESFKFLYPLFPLNEKEKQARLLEALERGRFEICDFLLSQDFSIEEVFEKFWKCESCPYYNCRRLIGKHLRALADRHSNRIQEMSPRHYVPGDLLNQPNWLERADSKTALSKTIKFLVYVRSKNGETVDSAEVTEMLHRVTYNRYLGDKDMTKIILRLLSMGANVSKEILDEFKEYRPNNVHSYQVLVDANEVNVKEPGCD